MISPDQPDHAESAPAGSSTPVRIAIEPHDRYRRVTLGAVILLVIAGAMAAFGLPPVDIHGPLHWVGIMDPLCGGTRAARYTAQGQWALAWKYNPLGIATVFAVGLVSLRAALGVTTRRWFTLRVAWTRRAKVAALVIAVALLVALEIRQQGRAELLMEGTRTLVAHPFAWSSSF